LAPPAWVARAGPGGGPHDDDGGGNAAGTGGKNTAGSGGKSTAGSGGKSTAGSGGKSTAGSNSTAGNNGTAGSTAGTPSTGGSGGDAGSNGGGGDAPLGGGGSGNESGGEGGGGNGNPPEMAAVFGDDYSAGISFVPFGGSTNAVTVDTSEAHAGNASLKIVVPDGNYTGGALVAATAADLSTHNAISFWAKASAAHTFDKVGFGNNALDAAPLQVERLALALTTEWQHFIVPIPAPSKLTSEVGLFHFAEGGENYTVWLDSIDYVTVDLGTPAPSIKTETKDIAVDGTFTIADTAVAYTVDAAPIALAVAPGWFEYESSDDDIASVSLAGLVTGEAVGAADITAKLGATDATGTVTVNVIELAVAAPTPAKLPADVISLFSNAYTNVAVATWSANWPDQADVADVLIAGNDTKVYTNLNYAGVDFGTTHDVSTMTHLHVDVWLPTATTFAVKLVDFGANGVYEGNGVLDDTEGSAEKTGLTTKTWQSLDFDLTMFPGLAARAHLAQMIITSGASATVYFDNVYFYK
jgi:hypothetical protein